MIWVVVVYLVGLLVTHVVRMHFSKFNTQEDFPIVGMIVFYVLWPIMLPLTLLISLPCLITYIRIKLGISEYD